jgi:transposase-like protein
VGPKHFQNPARRAWWSIHIEAWQRSGVSRKAYCRRQRLDEGTFARWLNVLAGEETARKLTEYHAELRREARREQRAKNGKRRQRRRYAVSTDTRSRAVQAFWAMHVEAMNWSGMSVREYAAALLLSPTSLRKWRDRLDDGELQVDWRAHLHPSARPISTSAGGSAKGSQVENSLTAAPDANPKQTRRSFTAEEKRAMVLETERSDATVSSVARRHGIVTSMLFRWRAELGFGKGKAANLAAVRITDDRCSDSNGAGADAVILHDVLPIPSDSIAVELADGRRVFAPPGSDPEAVRQYIAEREKTGC